MSTFDDLLPQQDVKSSGDTLPAERSFVRDAGVYPLQIDMAYVVTAESGSRMLHINFQEYPFKGYNVKQRLVLTSGRAKGCKNYFVDQDGNQRYLPGMDVANDIAQIAAGKAFGQIDFQMKKVPIYDFEARKELPTDVMVGEELIGAVLQVALTKIQENKRSKTEDGDWIDTNEMSEKNEIDKVFTEDGRTMTEVRAELAEGEYLNKWVKAKAGKVINKFKPIAGEATPGAPPPSAATTPATGEASPLFE